MRGALQTVVQATGLSSTELMAKQQFTNLTEQRRSVQAMTPPRFQESTAASLVSGLMEAVRAQDLH